MKYFSAFLIDMNRCLADFLFDISHDVLEEQSLFLTPKLRVLIVDGCSFIAILFPIRSRRTVLYFYQLHDIGSHKVKNSCYISIFFVAFHRQLFVRPRVRDFHVKRRTG